MRKLAAWIIVLCLVLPAFAAAKKSRRSTHKKTAARSTAVKPKAAASSKSSAPAKSGTSKKSSRATSRSGSRKKGSRTARTRSTRQGWRSGQMQPAPERYVEIQQALIAKGYNEGPATGDWDARWTESLKRFQRDQNLEASGKLTALSLMALGLGPKREAVGTETGATAGVPPEDTSRVPQ